MAACCNAFLRLVLLLPRRFLRGLWTSGACRLLLRCWLAFASASSPSLVLPPCNWAVWCISTHAPSLSSMLPLCSTSHALGCSVAASCPLLVVVVGHEGGGMGVTYAPLSPALLVLSCLEAVSWLKDNLDTQSEYDCCSPADMASLV